MNVKLNGKACLLPAALLACAAGMMAQGPHPVLRTLHSFAGQPDDGAAPTSLAIRDGVLYGSTADGGSSNAGSVFSLTPPASAGGAWTETSLYSFPAPFDQGSSPYSIVLPGRGGILYSATFGGGTTGNGTVFSLTPPLSPGGDWTETTLYSFTGGDDGAHPVVLTGQDGILYGLTNNGGASNNGVVFSLTPPTGAPSEPAGAWTQAVLYTFTGGSDGAQPSGLVAGGDGVLYGATLFGGVSTNGVVFSLTPPPSPGGAWTETVLYNCAGGSDAALPVGVAIGSGGVLYGTSLQGGVTGGVCLAVGCGTVFSVSPPAAPSGPDGAWTEAVLYRFTGGTDGTYPVGGVAVGSGGVLYGATGATSALGTLFSLAPPASPGGAWTQTVLHTFTGQGRTGYAPSTGVLLGGDGMLYGATNAGGVPGHGTVYNLKP